ncbi:Mediator complex, subunit Med7 [Prunus dulcis]|uniref:Mediator of RNA polymerase II transcription subunit 7 n=1 Tax=Prunus dulcis TaxID=3755 RepID=A0A4Y1QUJ8_PRUDU|nr:Mediator complex, subunit Med7 [Prunus dulcis]
MARRCWQWLQRHIHHHHRIISSTKITCKIPNQLRSRPLRFKGHAFVMTDDILPSLEDQGVHQLYPKGPNIDFKKELRSLNRELQLHILELADILVERPSQYARRVEDISLIFKNLHHLLNSLRPHQARATLIHILELQIQRRKQAGGYKEEERRSTETSQGVYWNVGGHRRIFCAKVRACAHVRSAAD